MQTCPAPVIAKDGYSQVDESWRRLSWLVRGQLQWDQGRGEPEEVVHTGLGSAPLGPRPASCIRACWLSQLALSQPLQPHLPRALGRSVVSMEKAGLCSEAAEQVLHGLTSWSGVTPRRLHQHQKGVQARVWRFRASAVKSPEMGCRGNCGAAQMWAPTVRCKCGFPQKCAVREQACLHLLQGHRKLKNAFYPECGNNQERSHFLKSSHAL